MVTSYVIILAITGWLGGYALSLFALRVAKLADCPEFADAPGLVALVITIALLVVAAAPGPLIVGALLLLAASFLASRDHLPPVAAWGLPLVVALVTLSGITVPAGAVLPPIVIQLGAIALLYGMLFMAGKLPEDSRMGTVILWPLLPLIPAPFLGGASYLPLDIVLIATPLMGAQMMAGALNYRHTRASYILVIGWMIAECAAHGGWIPAGLALAAFVAALAQARQPRTGLPHAL